ncbi:MAG: antibiotic biosynthesis monooxygenase [Planctomycetes bacterium]|nr:antibiotic biosynthesis monooxygenase [Planctomycetota bacterium]
MFYINVWLTVNDASNLTRVRELLGQCARGSRAEDGCVRFEAYQSEADPKRFLLVEHWRTKDDWEAHRTRQTVQEIYIPQVLPLVTRDAHPCSMIP